MPINVYSLSLNLRSVFNEYFPPFEKDPIALLPPYIYGKDLKGTPHRCLLHKTKDSDGRVVVAELHTSSPLYRVYKLRVFLAHPLEIL